jgi:hypothetical protein
MEDGAPSAATLVNLAEIPAKTRSPDERGGVL